MMSRKQFEELMGSLKSIESKLDVLINLQRAIMPKPSIGREERKILKLCDKKHTIDEMMKESGKTRSNIESVLSALRKKGLVQSIQLKGKRVYGRI